MPKEIYVKLIKEWGGFQIGDIVRFGYNKGQGRIDAGEGIEVPKQKAVNDLPEPVKPKPEPPKVETTMAELKVEKAVVTPAILSEEEVVKRRPGRPRTRKGGG